MYPCPNTALKTKMIANKFNQKDWFLLLSRALKSLKAEC